MRMCRLVVVVVSAWLCLLAGCSAAGPARPQAIAPSAPPKDDGSPSQGGEGGEEHAKALEQLKIAPMGWAIDRQQSLRVLLPDEANWLRVKFWSTKSLVAFRYGKNHHAIVGGFVVHTPDENAPGACGKAFERWAQPWVDAFEVVITHDPPRAVTWKGMIVDIDSLVATTATLGLHDDYAAAYATYPAWNGACLVLGVAVPARDELDRAKAVRDRFVSDVLPQLQVVVREEPKELY
jgi:hypothetical protein